MAALVKLVSRVFLKGDLMVISNDLVLGIVVGIFLTVAFQGVLRFGQRLTSPGCLIPIGLVVAGFVVLVMTGVVEFQLFS